VKSIMVAEHNAEARIMSGSFAKGVLVLNSNMLCLLFAAFAALLLCSGSSFLLSWMWTKLQQKSLQRCESKSYSSRRHTARQDGTRTLF